ncbi:MAG: hypothetical protein M3Q33_04515 [Acidobacteriota bacterium]|nr:hypothetical protein [Acidobacteriota bacterium]
MSLIICPECTHEVSTTAAACPNCGHLIAPPIVKTRTIVQEVPREREGFPPWAFIPLGVLGLLLVFLLFYFLKSDDTAGSNINVNVTSRKPLETRETTVRTNSQPNEVAVPPSSQPQQVIVPQSAPPAPPSSETTITTVDPDKSSVSLEAKIATKSGNVQSVKNEEFYLLDESLESILSDADLSDETGQSTTTAFGMSIVFPDKYDETRKKALGAIKRHIKYNVRTDSSGKAEMKSVKPGSYYLFAITKSGNGFAVWNSSVSIVPGQNVLNITPASLTEVTQ